MKGFVVKSVLMLMLICVIVASLALGGCAYRRDNDTENPNENDQIPNTPETNEQGDDTMSITKNPIATITMNSGEVITIELYPEKAPQTVYNFISLANSGFYDGLILHRVIPGFVLQGGDPQGTGTGGPGYSIKGEFASNGHANDITHREGVISMARSANYDSGGSQFFLVVGDATFLDGEYAGFGKTVDKKSTDICMELSQVSTGAYDRPVDPPVMQSVVVDTFGYEYPEPTKLK